jgi:hypothetical protein
MRGMHDAGASQDYCDQGRIARSCAQRVGLQDRDRRRLRTGDRGIDDMGSNKWVSGDQTDTGSPDLPHANHTKS